MMEDLYVALKAANVSEEKARAAARAVAKHLTGRDDVEISPMAVLRTDLEREMTTLRIEFREELQALREEVRALRESLLRQR